jgi:hypothetical protein
MIRHIAPLFIALALAACGDSVTKLVNAKFPPIDAAAQRQAAIDSAAQALGRLTSPNITVNVGIEDIQQVLNTEDLRAQGVSKMSVSGNNQLIYIHLSFTRQFKEEDAGGDAVARNIIATLRPEISGNLQVYTGVTGAVQGNGEAARHLELRLLPGLARFEITEVKLAGNSDVTSVVQNIAHLLNRYRDNVTGVLTRSPLTRISIPALDNRPFDFAKKFTGSNGDAGSFSVTVDGTPVTVPFKLDGVVWLIDDKQLRALLQLTPPNLPLSPGVTVEPTFDKIRHQFTSLQDENFGTASGSSLSWLGIKKDLLALSMNSIANQSAACVSLAGDSKQKSKTKVELPDGSDMVCSIERDCDSKRECSFEASHDTRDCSMCILSRPQVCAPKICVPGSIFGPGGCTGGGCTDGGCAQMGNNPICEVEKAAQNQIYLVDANLRKADCDRLRTMETAACQVEVNTKKGLCDTAKTALQQLSQTGNFANLDMELNAHSDNLKVCLREFNLTPELDRISFALDVTGEAKADLDLKFVPLDIVGHLTCQFPWETKKTFDVSLRESRIPLASAIVLETDSGKAGLRFNTEETEVKAQMSPSPIEYLFTSKEMTLACQGINLLKPLAISLVPFVKELRGDFDYKLGKQEARVDLPLPELNIGGLALRLTAGQTPKALLMFATISPPPTSVSAHLSTLPATPP